MSQTRANSSSRIVSPSPDADAPPPPSPPPPPSTPKKHDIGPPTRDSETVNEAKRDAFLQQLRLAAGKKPTQEHYYHHVDACPESYDGPLATEYGTSARDELGPGYAIGDDLGSEEVGFFFYWFV